MLTARFIRWTLIISALVLPAITSAQTSPDGASEAPDKPATAEVEQLYIEGAALYRSNKFSAAIEKFQEAYRLYPDPNLLYNIARSKEALGQIAAAMETYRKCLDDPKTSADVRDKARQRLDMLEQAQSESEKAALDAPAWTEGSATGTDTSPEEKPSPLPPEAPERQPEAGGSALTVTKWIAGGLGVALAAGGAVSLGLGAADHWEIDDAKDAAGDGVADMTRQEALDLQDSGETKKLIGYILIGAGAAAVITSGVLFWLDGAGAEADTSANDVALTAGVLPGGGAFTLSGRF